MSIFHSNINQVRWQWLRRKVFERDGYRCCICKRAGRLECDHVKPLKRGGAKYDMANLQTLCRSCHIRKTRLENSGNIKPDKKAWRELINRL